MLISTEIRSLGVIIDFQCLSSLFLNALIDSASATSCSSLSHSLITREVKKFSLTVVWYLDLNSFNECCQSQLVTSDSWKMYLSWHVLCWWLSWMSLLGLNIISVYPFNLFNLDSYESLLYPLTITVDLLCIFKTFLSFWSFCSCGAHHSIADVVWYKFRRLFWNPLCQLS